MVDDAKVGGMPVVEGGDAMRVLVVDDEPRLAQTVQRGLVLDGFTVTVAGNGPDGLRLALEEPFDVIVLDIMLPGLSGYEVLRRLRAEQVWTPVLMLTAKDGSFEETDAFDLGADDYLTKPFVFSVLSARLRALMRRGAPPRPTVLTAGNLALDPARHRVHRADAEISLTPREFALLEHLIRHVDTVVTKTAILQSVWDAHYRGAENVVEVYIGYLRKKIDIPFGCNSIDTLRGVGYRLRADGGVPADHQTQP